MRFFTLQWWRGETTDDAGAKYLQHLESIRSQLTPTLQDLAFPTGPEEGLHDSRLRDLQLDISKASLVVHLDSYDNSRRLLLRYAGVSSFCCSGDPRTGLRGPHGFGDLGYHEVDVTPEGFEHRLLFSTGIEMRVSFRDASVERRPAGQ